VPFIVVVCIAAAVVLVWLSRALNDEPTCAQRGGTPVTWEHRDACQLPGGVIAPLG
jgi:hypothetical protein